MSKLIISLFLTIFLIYDVNCGIISWFKSIGKPEWYSKIDKPLIEVFEPKGLRVSIADTNGLKLFKFHGNINNNPLMLEKTIAQKSNGRWWYINDDIEMKIGDKLIYWIYVQVNDEEMLFSRETHKVKNVIPLPSSLSSISDDHHHNNVEWSNANVTELCPCTNVTSSSEMSREYVELTKNEYSALNHAIIEQVNELESVYRLIHEEMKNNTKLLFVDDKRNINDIKLSEIQLIIEEKLYLNKMEQISLQDTTRCGVLFDVLSTVDKMRIMINSSKFLKNTSQKFLEPTESDSKTFQSRNFEINDPIFVAFRPNGLQISIEYVKGLQVFGFHGNLNKPININESGEYHNDLKLSENGKWTFYINDIELCISDVINYWLYVQIDNVSVKIPHKRFVVREFITKQPNLMHQSTTKLQQSSIQNVCYCNNIVSEGNNFTITIVPDAQPQTLNNNNYNQTHLEQLENQLNLLQNQFNGLNEVLNDLMKDLEIGTELLLIGVNPGNLNPLYIVRDVISNQLDLYDLSEKVLKAEHRSNGILFKMSSSIDKKRILIRSVKFLKNPRMQILDYMETNFGDAPATKMTTKKPSNTITIVNMPTVMTPLPKGTAIPETSSEKINSVVNNSENNPNNKRKTDEELIESGVSDIFDIDFRMGSLIRKKTTN